MALAQALGDAAGVDHETLDDRMGRRAQELVEAVEPMMREIEQLEGFPGSVTFHELEHMPYEGRRSLGRLVTDVMEARELPVFMRSADGGFGFFASAYISPVEVDGGRPAFNVFLNGQKAQLGFKGDNLQGLSLRGVLSVLGSIATQSHPNLEDEIGAVVKRHSAQLPQDPAVPAATGWRIRLPRRTAT